MPNDIDPDVIREIINVVGIDSIRECLIAAGAKATYVDDGKNDLIIKVGPHTLLTIHEDGTFTFPEEEPIDED